MRHIKPLVAIAALACATMARTPSIAAKADKPSDEKVVAAMADPPEFLGWYCLSPEPTRDEVSVYRIYCDTLADKSGYNHGILRPPHQNDYFGVAMYCEKPGAAVYVCLGVGGR